jgi:hypothetical protein
MNEGRAEFMQVIGWKTRRGTTMNTWTLRKIGRWVQNEFIWIETSGDLFQNGNKPLSSIECWEILQ